jgi:GAF domain-containing protein
VGIEIEMKKEKYTLLTEQIRALIEGETDRVAVMANVSAAIHETMGFWWTGFYRVIDGELVLGPFQGPVACMHIGFGKGVCGTAWKEQRTIVVPDVELFPGHIACSSLSRSEIVVPVFSKGGAVVAVLDIDSKDLATFDDVDQLYFEGICKLLTPLF